MLDVGSRQCIMMYVLCTVRRFSCFCLGFVVPCGGSSSRASKFTSKLKFKPKPKPKSNLSPPNSLAEA